MTVSSKYQESLEILAKAAERVALKGGTLVNVDSTMIAEAPKILPHAEAMKANSFSVPSPSASSASW